MTDMDALRATVLGLASDHLHSNPEQCVVCNDKADAIMEAIKPVIAMEKAISYGEGKAAASPRTYG